MADVRQVMSHLPQLSSHGPTYWSASLSSSFDHQGYIWETADYLSTDSQEHMKEIITWKNSDNFEASHMSSESSQWRNMENDFRTSLSPEEMCPRLSPEDEGYDSASRE